MKKVYLIAGGILFVLVMVFLLWPNPSAKIEVLADPDATVTYSTERGGELASAGVGDQIITIEEESVVYIQSSTADGAKFGSVIVDNLEDSYSLDLRAITDVGSIEVAYQGSQSNPIATKDGDVQAVDPESFNLLSFNPDGDSDLRLDFIGLPSIREINWRDEDNFVFLGFGQGFGAFIDGSRVPQNQLLTNLSIDEGNIADSIISLAANNTYVFVHEGESIYRSENFGRTAEQFVKLEESDEPEGFSMSATRSILFGLQSVEPSVFASEADSEPSNLPVAQSSLTLYDGDGQEVSGNSVRGSSLIATSEIDSRVCVLTDFELMCADLANDNYWQLPLYELFVADVFAYNDKFFVLHGDKLSAVNFEKQSLELVDSLGDGEVGLLQSMYVRNGNLLFGVVPRESGVASPKTYRLQ